MKIKGFNLYYLAPDFSGKRYFAPDVLCLQRALSRILLENDDSSPVSVCFYAKDTKGDYVKRYARPLSKRSATFALRFDVLPFLGVCPLYASIERKTPDDAGKDVVILAKLREIAQCEDFLAGDALRNLRDSDD